MIVSSQNTTPNRRGRFRHVWAAVRVRLRFVVVAALMFLLLGQWERIGTWARYLGRLATGTASADRGVSSDTEYFCPMCPGVLSTWPEKCPVCNMPLVRRQTGEAVLLPEGVTARMQFSPDRVQLAGIRTAPVEYLELFRELSAPGVVSIVEGDESRFLVEARFDSASAALLSIGAKVEVAGRLGAGRGRWSGDVVAVEPVASPASGSIVRCALECPQRDLFAGDLVEVSSSVNLADLEPFRSQPREAPPLEKGAPRKAHVCPVHQNVIALAAGKCPLDGEKLVAQPLVDNQRIGWWCPAHPEVVANSPEATCEQCGGMPLSPRIVTYSPAGKVLAVPQSAVVDSGALQVVYLEHGAGMFDGVKVDLGSPVGDYYPVVSGLQAGQRVAAAGTFLIDAETRLNPHLASAYFGAAGQTKATAASVGDREDAGKSVAIEDAIAALSAADRALAMRQKVCPVTKLPLGSMGAPIKIESQGNVAFICCEGCRAKFLKDRSKRKPAKSDD